MEPVSRKGLLRALPLSIGVTFLVVGLPLSLAVILRFTGILESPPLLVFLPVLLSLAISWLGSRLWKRHSSGDQLFEDLLIWGWVRNWRFSRLLSRTETFVGPGATAEFSQKQRAKMLIQLSGALEAMDSRTYGHSRRVAAHAAKMASRLGLPKSEVARIRTAALLHDVGKINTPHEIINKPASLTDAEFDVIKRHPGDGAAMVADLGDPELTAIVRHHHERYNGGGYPDGVTHTEVPIGSLIIAVADTFDALTSARPYRAAMSHEKAMAVLVEEAGEQLDPRAVGVFERNYSGHRPIAFWAVLLGLGRQLGQGLVGLGTGASQVAAVGAAAIAIGVVPGHYQPVNSKPQREATPVVDSNVVGASRTDLVAGANPNGPADGTGKGGGNHRKNRDSGKANGALSEGPQAGQVRVDPGDGVSDSDSGSSGGSGGGGSDSGAGGGSGTGDDPGAGAGSGGSQSTGTSAGSTSGSSGSPLVETVDQVTDVVPAVPEQVPGSEPLNEVLDGVKDLPGKLLGGKP